MQRIALQEPVEAEEAPAIGMFGEPAREFGSRPWMRCAPLGLALAAVALVALAAHSVPGLRGAELTAVAQKVQIPRAAFEQCGGEGYTNYTCCAAGCACVVQTKYYSGCAAPGGLDDCNVKAMKNEIEASSDRLASRKSDLETAEQDLKDAKEAAENAKKAREEAVKKAHAAIAKAEPVEHELHEKKEKATKIREGKEADANAEMNKTKDEAKAVFDKKTIRAAAVRDKKLQAAADAKAAVLKEKKDTQAAYEEADKKAAAKTKEYVIAKGHVDKFHKDEKIRDATDCGALFGECSATNCCVLGCECHWQNKFFGQCEGPGGLKYCAVDDVMNVFNNANTTLPTLTKEKHELDKDNKTKYDVSVSKAKTYDKVAAESAKETKAANDEFAESTIEPAEEKKKKDAAAEEHAKTLIANAIAEFKATMDKAHADTKDILDAKDSAVKVRDEKMQVEKDAFSQKRQCTKVVHHAKTAKVKATAALASWKKAADGKSCDLSLTV